MVLFELPKNLPFRVSLYVRHKFKLKTEIEYSFIALNFDNIYLFGSQNYPRINLERKVFKDFWDNVESFDGDVPMIHRYNTLSNMPCS